VALQTIIFPIDQPIMPEDRQIGRKSTIDRLEARLEGGVNQWILGERRIGKTSVAKAALARLRGRGNIALDVDLSKLAISSSVALAGELARQAQAARAGDPDISVRNFLGIAMRQKGRIKNLGQALGELGYNDAGEALDAVAAVLAGADDGAPGLDNVLAAVSLHALATERRACVLIDEVHLLAELDGAEAEVASQCRAPESPIVFVFAGSEESSARALRDRGRPLAAVGEAFDLSQIADEEWVPGLAARFEESGIAIGEDELRSMISASGGHPRRTMLIASRVRAAAAGQPDKAASGSLVEFAIREAERDLSWR
jgi:hypothetical protein